MSNHLHMHPESAFAQTPDAPACPMHCIPVDEPLISVHDLAAWLAVAPDTVRKWCAQGPEAMAPDGRTKLNPLFRYVNGQIRFDRPDVRAWLETKVAVA
ncbi:MAG: helix-turn-helix domain-containing protein [Nocardioidaceae bacterium]